MSEQSVVLSTRDVVVHYPGSDVPALRIGELDILRGSTLGIVGESGSGKSTLAKVLVGALSPTSGATTVYGQPWSATSRKDSRRRRVQMVFQDPYASLNPLVTVLDTVAEVSVVWDRVSRREARRRAAALLEHVGLAAQFHEAKPGQLSGGQCQRVGIARALASEPEVLIADEPTSALDVSLQAGILNLLLALREERGLAIVLVSHDLAVVNSLTDTTLVLYQGELVERGPTMELMAKPRHPYTDLLLASVPGSHRVPESPAGLGLDGGACAFVARCPRATQRCVAEHPELPDLEHAYRCHHPLPPS